MTATLILDLSADLDSLLAQMRPTTRHHIRRAAREGMIQVREGTEQDVETFRELMWALCERRGVGPIPPQKDFFANLWRIFQPSGFLRLFVAELDGHPVAASLTIPFGNTVRFWKIGWAGDHAKRFPNEALNWEAIRWSKLNGYRFFDFVQIDRNVALALLEGQLVDWNHIFGWTNFKLGFGGTPMVLAETYYRFYHPLLQIFARAGGSRLIESDYLGRLAKRFWRSLDRS